MKKKLLTLAVAAAVAAPTLASAEAIMYGKLNMSIDYEDIDYATGFTPLYNNSATILGAGDDYYIDAAGTVQAIVPVGTVLTAAQIDALSGYTRVAPGQAWNGQGFEGWSLNRGPNLNGAARANRLGVKGSEDLGNGLKAIYQIELGINMANANQNIADNNDGITYRNTFLGLAGDWGTFLIGRHDTPLKISTSKLDLFADTMADYNGTVGFQDIRADNAIAYVSPSWAGFQLAAAIVPAGGATANNFFGENINADSIGEAYSLAAIYSNGPFYASIAYENLGEQLLMGDSTAISNSLTGGCTTTLGTGWSSYGCDVPDDDWTKYRIGLGLLDWNGFTLTGIYEHHELPTYANSYTTIVPGLSYNLPVGVGVLGGGLSQWGYADTADLWQLQAGYSFGNFMIKAMYGEMQRDGSYTLPNYGLDPNSAVYNEMADNLYQGTRTTWAVGADYNFSQRTKAYVLYTEVSDDMSGYPSLLAGGGPAYLAPGASFNSSDWSGFSLGLMHSF